MGPWNGSCLQWPMLKQWPSNRTAEFELVRRAQAGDKEAFCHLYEAHKGRVYGICLRIVRGDSALSTWLYRLTVNVVLMRLRTSRSAPISLDTSGQGESRESPIAHSCPVQDLALLGTVDRITLRRALRKLPPGYRTVFLLHDVQGKAHSEIARELGCSVGNSKSQLHQARLRLRRFLPRKVQARRPTAA